MTAKIARFLHAALVSAVLVVAFVLAAFTLAGGFDSPGNVSGSVTQVGTVVTGSVVTPGNFEPTVTLDTTQVTR